MRCSHFFLAACLVAALVPLVQVSLPSHGFSREFPGWPERFEGQRLEILPLSDVEKRFEREFPGKIAKFSDGNRTIVMRWVTKETRKLHPAADCFKASGYDVKPLPLAVDDKGNRWGSFQAIRSTEKLHVREQIRDEQGNTWTDVSAWYWAALAAKTHGSWWAVTLVGKAIESPAAVIGTAKNNVR